MKTCNEKIANLGLHFPTTEKKEKLAFIKLTREYNSDICETSECKIVSEQKIVEIMEAHQFWQANHGICNKIANDYANKVNKILNIDFEALDPSLQEHAIGLAAALEKFEGHN